MKKILVIDDEAAMRQLLQDALEAEYAVTLAANGREAQQLLEDNTYDLLITDLVMPEMNGIALVMAVKNKNPAQKIIAISGGGGIVGSFDYLPVVQLLGADKIFSKPFQLSDLKNTIKSLLV